MGIIVDSNRKPTQIQYESFRDTGKDRRQLVTRHIEISPYKCCGLIQLINPDKKNEYKPFSQGSSIATGFLIAPNLVLTAAHSIFYKNSQIRKLQPLYFYPGLSKDNKVSYQVEKYWIEHNYEFQYGKYQKPKRNHQKIQMIKIDYMLIKLKERIKGYKKSLYLLLNYHLAHDNTCKIEISGYSQYAQKQNKLKYHMYTHQDKIQSINQNVITHTVDTTKGQSGSPITIQQSNQIYTIGIHLQGGEKKNFGLLLTDLVINRLYELTNNIQDLKQIRLFKLDNQNRIRQCIKQNQSFVFIKKKQNIIISKQNHLISENSSIRIQRQLDSNLQSTSPSKNQRQDSNDLMSFYEKTSFSSQFFQLDSNEFHDWKANFDQQLPQSDSYKIQPSNQKMRIVRQYSQFLEPAPQLVAIEPFQEKISYIIKLQMVAYGGKGEIGFGFLTQNRIRQKCSGFEKQKDSICFWTNINQRSGSIIEEGQVKTFPQYLSKKMFINVNDVFVIKKCYAHIIWEINGERVAVSSISDAMKKKKIYFFIAMHNRGDQIQILN